MFVKGNIPDKNLTIDKNSYFHYFLRNSSEIKKKRYGQRQFILGNIVSWGTYHKQIWIKEYFVINLVSSANLMLPESDQRLEFFGCKLSAGGAHNSRTMMLSEISRLLTSVSDSAPFAEYRKAILETNVLGKGTLTTREKTFRYLRELYALSD